MKNYEGFIRGYHRTSKAWYANPEKDIEVLFGLYHPEGGTIGEINMKWIELLDGNLYPKLECFADSWYALFSFTDLLEKMAELAGKQIKIKETDFCEMLNSCGFKDLTHYKLNDNNKL